MPCIQPALPLTQHLSHPRRLPVLLFVEILASFQQGNSGEGRVFFLRGLLLSSLARQQLAPELQSQVFREIGQDIMLGLHHQ